MKVIFALLSLFAAANAGLIAAPAVVSAPTIIARAPSLDSAVIKSDRLGGNFAYSVAESHAYAAHTPIIQHVATPVAVSYSAPILAHPITYSTSLTVAAPVVKAVAPVLTAPTVAAVKTIAAPTVLAAPVLKTIVGTPAATVKIA